MPLTDITMSPSWQALQQLVGRSKELGLSGLFAAEPTRFEQFSLGAPNLFLDYSKTHVNAEVIRCLLELAHDAGVPEAIDAMFSGARLNTTEDRAAMHFALRESADRDDPAATEEVMQQVRETARRVEACSEQIRSGQWLGSTGKPIRHIIHIGIGGSGLGPRMVMQALGGRVSGAIQCHFVSNVDSEELLAITRPLPAEETLVIVVSKSFTTLETRLNGESARRWLRDSGIPEAGVSRHLIAISSNVEAAIAFGIPPEQVFPMWDWVGGRYSLWSAVGLVLSIALGSDVVRELLRGAEEMDQHFRSAPLEENMPVILALIGVWYINFRNSQTLAVIPYSHRLNLLPDYLQQLEMESNGKSVTHQGTPMMAATAPILWGGEGSNSQHSFHQLLLQGSRVVPVDFILPLTAPDADPRQQEWLVANCLSQSRALMVGRDHTTTVSQLMEQGMSRAAAERAAPHRVVAGNRPSSTIIMEALTPRALGALLALYEHKVFIQGVIWNINSFDQWGVELGKRLADDLHPLIVAAGDPAAGDPAAGGPEAGARATDGVPDTTLDSSTRGLVQRYKKAYNSIESS